MHILIGPILDDRLKENSWNPERVPSVVTLCVCLSVCLCVCLCVCAQATGHTFWPRNLIFGLSDPWDMRKKRIFLFFEIFIFTLFIGIFRFFPYITLVNFWFQASGHSFSPRIVIFGLSEPCTIENWRLSDFLVIFQYNFGDFWDIHGMRPIILGYFFQQLRWK